MEVPVAVCLVLCVIGLLQSASMMLYSWEHRRHYRSRLAADLSPWPQPSVTLFVPCKGLDVGMESNLRALFEQKYDSLELRFLVESESDPATEVIRGLQAQCPEATSRLIFTGVAEDCGQKVHNLMRGTVALPLESEVLAFVDSDARPHSLWLARLVDRLKSGKFAVATGYRWYVPVRPTFANRILSAINNNIVGLMGSHGFNLVWGGAWAIRTEVFRQIGLPQAWHGSLSDDLVVSRLVHAARLKVAFEPHCLVKSPAKFTWSSLAEFLRRQYLVVRIYAPFWWRFALLFSGMSNLVVWGLAGFTVWWGLAGGPWHLPAVALFLCYVATAIRGEMVSSAVQPFVDVTDDTYQSVARISIWAWPVVSLVNGLGLVSSAIGRTIDWRGIRYRLDSTSKTSILNGAAGEGHSSSTVPKPAPRAA